MNVTKINYQSPDETTYTASVLAKDKEDAVEFIKKVTQVKRVNSISSIGAIHAISDNIIEKITSNNPEMKKNKERIEKLVDKNKELEDQLKGFEYENDQLRQERDRKQHQPSSAEIAKSMKENKGRTYVCPYCEYETEKKAGIKMHISKSHKNKEE